MYEYQTQSKEVTVSDDSLMAMSLSAANHPNTAKMLISSRKPATFVKLKCFYSLGQIPLNKEVILIVEALLSFEKLNYTFL